MFVVRNERFRIIAMFPLASDAYAERNTLVRTTKRHHTVSYLMKK